MSRRKNKCCEVDPRDACNKNMLLFGLIAVVVFYYMINQYNNMLFNQNRYLLDNTVNQNNCLIDNIICNSNNVSN